jgi:hypothetical protein
MKTDIPSNAYKDPEWLREQYDHGLTQKEIAEKADVSRQTIIKYFKKYDIKSSKRKYTDDELLNIMSNNPDVTTAKLDSSDNDLPSAHVYKSRFGSMSRAKELAGIGKPTIKCHSCGKRYRKISRHWYESECSYPEISDRQKSILIGLMMGDATLGAKSQSNPFVGVANTNLGFLQWVHNELEDLSYNPTLLSTAKEKYESNIESGFVLEESANVDNYNDVYYLNTVSHKEFDNLDWMRRGIKVIPKEIPIDSMIAKMWYCSDGSLHWRPNREKAEARITNVTENDNLEKFKIMFQKAGFDVRVSGKEIQFNIEQTSKLLEWMGEPPDGMEYKWKYKDKSEYNSLKR